MKKKAYNRIDMTGKVYNSWLVVEPDYDRSKGKALYWKTKCLECNDTYSVWGANIRNGLSKRCVKCGCKHTHSAQKGQVRTSRTPEETAHHYQFMRLKKEARQRKLEWSLTEAEVKQLITSPCFYDGQLPSLVCEPLKYHKLSQKNTKAATLVRGGIDRVDPSKGYIQGNVVPCCEQCNSAKMDYTLEEFRTWAIRLAKKLQEAK